MRSESAAIVLNAPVLDAEITERDIICADGGYNLIEGAFSCVAVVGDCDSVKNIPEGTELIRCPTDKNYTDGERAVMYAAETGYKKITLYGAAGGRSDHQYANLSLLALASELGLEAVAKSKSERVYFFPSGDVRLSAEKGDFLSALPYGESVTLDKSRGLKYPYDNLTLRRSRSRGVSNEVLSQEISFSVTQGSAFVL
jgi:thiamine pyrophosphokinase